MLLDISHDSTVVTKAFRLLELIRLAGITSFLAFAASSSAFAQSDSEECDVDGFTQYLGAAFVPRPETVRLIGSFDDVTRCETALSLSESGQSAIRRLVRAAPMLPQDLQGAACLEAYILNFVAHHIVVYEVKKGWVKSDFTVTEAQADNLIFQSNKNKDPVDLFSADVLQTFSDGVVKYNSISDDELLKELDTADKSKSRGKEALCKLVN